MPSGKRKGKGKKMKRDLDKKRGAQAALDYLVSWGWVLIVIVLVLVILFSLGIFKVPSAPTIITGFQGITMQAAQANSTMLVVELTNNYNQFVNITGITVNVNGNNYTSDSCLNTIISDGQSTLCRVPVSIPTHSYLSKIQISFTPYKSTTSEVSNGTVSSTLLSGSIPINNQLTYFLERGLPYGSTFTVNYNTSTNSTVISSIKDNVSFNLPFGKYYFSVPTVNYQGCVSVPSPSSGDHSTGVGELILFTSNCTTTFTETGLPSGQIWQVSFNGTTKSTSTGSSITIKTNNTQKAYSSYVATAKSDSLSCVSSFTPSVSLGSSYTFSAWNCTTTFTETGLPTGQGWTANYDNLADKGSTNSPTTIIFSNDKITSISKAYAFSSSNQLSCYTGSVSLYMGSSYTFSAWNCTTTFTETGLPSGQSWKTTYNSTSNSANTGSAITFFASDLSNVALSYSASSLINNLDCEGSDTPSVSLGSSYTFSAWNCTTTFTETGLPSGQSWKTTYNSTSNSANTGSAITFFASDLSNVALSYSASSLINNLDCEGSDTPSVSLGSSYTFSAWNCTTTFTETGLPSGQIWQVSFNGTTKSTSTGSSITIKTNNTQKAYSSYVATAKSDSLSCVSSFTPSVSLGSSYTFSAWNCTTTFSNPSFANSPENKASQWTMSFDGERLETSSTGMSFIQDDVSNVGTYSFQPFTEGNILCTGDYQSAQMGGSYTLGENWLCYTALIPTFNSAGDSEIDVIPEFYPATVLSTISSNIPSNAFDYNSGGFSDMVAYNPNTNEFYIPMGSRNSILVLNDSTDQIVTTISTYSGAHPIGIYYANGYVYVLNANGILSSDTIQVINGNSFTSANTSIGILDELGYNYYTHYLWIPNSNTSTNSYEISTVEADSQATFDNSLGSPFSADFLGNPGYCASNVAMYVPGTDTSGDGEVEEYNAVNGQEISTISVNSITSTPSQAVCVPPTTNDGFGQLYVAGLNNIAVINVSNNAVNTPFSSLSSDALLYYDEVPYMSSDLPGSALYALNNTNGNSSTLYYFDPNRLIFDGVSTLNVGYNATGIGGVKAGESVDTSNPSSGTSIEEPIVATFYSSTPPASWSVNLAKYGWSSSSGNSAVVIPLAYNNGHEYKYSIPIVCDFNSNVEYEASPSSGTIQAGQTINVTWIDVGSC
ncbi:MAG: hypothetical protein BJBARM4_0948 [Candidatus Parvarchaeum acidiphilum ARMAN-4]|uniref:Uncharacterized protein n=1 Tax=Candidatus Parvarchaeum acidiphilum ARMAN-4 TaxID=662760 RepID=D2EGP9_PARA4|nr:MAG: hypothetical protein BJBARM4_0948 [Candidatus Parvarchaeum acidiphilum ARMAN-4]